MTSQNDGGAPPDCVDISICICTRNRAASLAVTLAALDRCTRPQAAWEILIVDNGSTDGTAATIASFADRLPIRVVGEPLAGAANARNTAAREARGTYMVCTDDDTIPDPGWIVSYEAAFTEFPDAALFGGRIVPELAGQARPWFSASLSALAYLVAARDFGPTPSSLALVGDRIPFGANYAVRSAVQRHFTFDPMLGPGAPYFGEETTSFKAMLEAGQTGRWVPDSAVRHVIPAARQTKAYVRWWYRMHGRTMGYERGRCDDVMLLGIPRWLWRRRFQTAIAYRWSRLFSPPPVWVARLVSASLASGEFDFYANGLRQR